MRLCRFLSLVLCCIAIFNFCLMDYAAGRRSSGSRSSSRSSRSSGGWAKTSKRSQGSYSSSSRRSKQNTSGHSTLKKRTKHKTTTTFSASYATASQRNQTRHSPAKVSQQTPARTNQQKAQREKLQRLHNQVKGSPARSRYVKLGPKPPPLAFGAKNQELATRYPVSRKVVRQNQILQATKSPAYNSAMRGRNGRRSFVPKETYHAHYSTYYGSRSMYPGYDRYGSSFGMWNSVYWWGCLAEIDAACTMSMFHHWNDPGFIMFYTLIKQRRDDQSESAEIRTDLTNRIAYLEGQMEVLNQTERRDPTYIPAGMSKEVAASVMFTPEIVIQPDTSKLILKVGTGSQTAAYYEFCQKLKKHAESPSSQDMVPLNIRCVSTGGTQDNLEKLQTPNQEDSDQVFNAAMVQADAYNEHVINFNKTKTEDDKDVSLVLSPYTESIVVLASKENNQNSVKAIFEDSDIKELTLVTIGSGAEFTWSVFRQFSPYANKNVTESNVKTMDEALKLFDANPKGTLISFVERYNSKKLTDLEADSTRSNTMRIVPFYDKTIAQLEPQFDTTLGDEQPEGVTTDIYTLMELRKVNYNDLSSDWTGSTTPMLGVAANFVVSGAWVANSSVFAIETLEQAIQKSSIEFKKTLAQKSTSIIATTSNGNIEIPIDYSESDEGKPVLNVCTGGTSGTYIQVGLALSQALQNQFKINVLSTSGSGANLDGMLRINHSVNSYGKYYSIVEQSGQYVRDQEVSGAICHLGIYQSDADLDYFRTRRSKYRFAQHSIKTLGDLYPEMVFIITHRDSEDDDFSKARLYLDQFSLTQEAKSTFLSTLMIGDSEPQQVMRLGVVQGSGSENTVSALGKIVEKYNGVIPVRFNSWNDLIENMKSDNPRIDGFVYVGHPNNISDSNNGLLTRLGNNRQYQLASFESKNLTALTNEKLMAYLPYNLKSEAFGKTLNFWSYGGLMSNNSITEYPTVGVTARIGIESTVMAALQQNEAYGNSLWPSFQQAVTSVVGDFKEKKTSSFMGSVSVPKKCSWFCF